MDFELSDEQTLFRSGLRDLLDRACGIRHVREVAYDGDGRDRPLWQELAGAGWTALTIPEADGGEGLGFEELMLAATEAGRAVLPLPLTTTLLAARMVGRAPKQAYRSYACRRICSGESSVTIALRGSPDDWNGERPSMTATREGSDWKLNGSLAFVPYGPLADLVLVEAEMTEGGRGLFLTPTSDDDASWQALDTLDSTVPQYELTITNAIVPEGASLYRNEDAGSTIDDLQDEWRAVLAAETLGASERMLEMCVAYAQERVQFDRPIGSNQAVKGRVAEMGAAVERMRAAVYHAAVKIDSAAGDRALAVAMAKAATSEPGNFIASQAIHVHGGIGYTWEHDLHIYFKRVKANELLLGDEQSSLARVAAAVL